MILVYYFIKNVICVRMKMEEMMDPNLRTQIEIIKKEVLVEAEKMTMINRMIPISGKRVSLPLRGREIEMIYYPAVLPDAPLLLGFHGGGFLFGGCAMDDPIWVLLSKELGVNVASIGYRKAPEYMYPAGLEDAYDAAAYLRDHAEEYGFDHQKISVFGSSAGANLAAAVCIYAKAKGENLFQYQILNYPYIDCDTDPAEKGTGSLDGPIMYVFRELYFRPEDRRKSTASPVFASEDELKGLPEAIITVCEEDNLRAEGEKYGELLKNAGVKVHLALAEGMPHGYFEYGLGNADNIEFLDDYMKDMIRDGSMRKQAEKSLEFIKSYYNRE